MVVAERFLAPSILAFAMTFALFWLMQALVDVEDQILDHTPRSTIVPYVKVYQPGIQISIPFRREGSSRYRSAQRPTAHAVSIGRRI